VVNWRQDTEEPETWIRVDDYEGTRGIVTISGSGAPGQWVGSPEQLRALAAELLDQATECERARVAGGGQ